MSKVFRAGIGLQFPVTGDGTPFALAAQVETAFAQFRTHLATTFPDAEVTHSSGFTSLRNKVPVVALTSVQPAQGDIEAAIADTKTLDTAGVDANAGRVENAA